LTALPNNNGLSTTVRPLGTVAQPVVIVYNPRPKGPPESPYKGFTPEGSAFTKKVFVYEAPRSTFYPTSPLPKKKEDSWCVVM